MIKPEQHSSDIQNTKIDFLSNIDSCTWKYNQGAHTRQHLFNINDDIFALPKRNREDSDHILDPTLSSSQIARGNPNRSNFQNKSAEEIHLFDTANYPHMHSVNVYKSLLQDTNLINSNAGLSGAVSLGLISNGNSIEITKKNEEFMMSQPRFIHLTRQSCSSQIASEHDNINADPIDDTKQGDCLKSFSHQNIEQQYNSPARMLHSPAEQELDSSPSKIASVARLAHNNTTNSAIIRQSPAAAATSKGGAYRGSLGLTPSEIDKQLYGQTALTNFVSKMKVSQLTKRFIDKISSYSANYNLKHLTTKHYSIIGDPTSFFNSKKKPQPIKPFLESYYFYKHFKKSVKHLSNKFSQIKPLNPESRFAILLDITYAIVLLAYLLIVPIELSFDVSFKTFELFVFLIFLMNFSFALNKSFYSQGIIITNRALIIQHFLKTQLLVDIVVFLTIIIGQFQYLAFIKFFDITKIVKRADNHFQMIRKYPIAFTLTNLVLKMTLMAQIAGCAFHYVARVEIESGNMNNWIAYKQMENATWESRYIISIYFSFITMMTVGYGDVVPVNNAERIYVIFMTLLSSGIFGYVVNTIGELYMQQRQKREQFQKRKQEITVYMDTRNIQSLSKLRVLNYLEYAFSYQKKKDADAATLFQDIPQNLVNEIYLNYFGKYLLENRIMRINFTEECLKALALCMQEKNVAPSDEIGMKSSFADSERPMSVKCQKDQACTLVYFQMADFKNILLKFQKDFEKYCELRDDIIFNKNTLDTKCHSCSRYEHTFTHCPLINLNIPHENVIARCQSGGEPNKRAHSVRRQFIYQALKSNELTKQKLKEYRICLIQLIMPEIRDNLPDFNNRSDRFFYQKVPTVRIVEQNDDPDMEEYNIYEEYATISPGDALQNNQDNNCDEDEEDEEDGSDTQRLLQLQLLAKRQAEDEHGNNYLLGGDQPDNNNFALSGSNLNLNNLNQGINQQIIIQTPSLTSVPLTNQQLQPNQIRDSFQSQILSSTQKVSFFSRKQTNTNENIPGSPQLENNTAINQLSSRNPSIRRERGDSFYPSIRGSKQSQQQYSQQRSLQSRVKSTRKLSEIRQNSLKPFNIQVSMSALGEASSNQQQQQQYDTSILLDFDKMKLYEKYYPMFNFNIVLSKMSSRKKTIGRSRKQHRTVLVSPAKRKPRNSIKK